MNERRSYSAGPPRGGAAAAAGVAGRARSAPAASRRQQPPRLAARLSGAAAHALGIDAARGQARLGERGAVRSEYGPAEASGVDLHRRSRRGRAGHCPDARRFGRRRHVSNGRCASVPQRRSRSLLQGWSAAAAAVAPVAVLRPVGDTAGHAWHAQPRERRSRTHFRCRSSSC